MDVDDPTTLGGNDEEGLHPIVLGWGVCGLWESNPLSVGDKCPLIKINDCEGFNPQTNE